MTNRNHIDFDLIDHSKLGEVIEYMDYFSRENNTFYRATKDAEYPYEYAAEVKSFIKSLYEANLIQPFNWVEWKDSQVAQHLSASPDHILEGSIEDVIKLLTLYLRADRFIGGQLKDAIDGGYIQAILFRLYQLSRLPIA